MNKYKIEYTNAKGRKITAIAYGETTFEAAERYVSRVHWWDYELELCDAETRGVEASEGYFMISGPTHYGPYAYIEKVDD